MSKKHFIAHSIVTVAGLVCSLLPEPIRAGSFLLAILALVVTLIVYQVAYFREYDIDLNPFGKWQRLSEVSIGGFPALLVSYSVTYALARLFSELVVFLFR